MLAGGLIEAFLGIDAEGRSLEDLARPLGATDAPRPDALSAVTGAPRPPAARTVAGGRSLEDARAPADERRSRRRARPARPNRERVDEDPERSFPASDPPGHY